MGWLYNLPLVSERCVGISVIIVQYEIRSSNIGVDEYLKVFWDLTFR